MTQVQLRFQAPPSDAASTLTLLPFFHETPSHPEMKGDLALEAARLRFEGKLGDAIALSANVGVFRGLLGVGKSEDHGALRRAAYHAVRMAKEHKVQRLVLDVGDALSPEQATFLVEGLLLTTYSFDTYKKAKTEEEKTGQLQEIYVVAKPRLTPALNEGRVHAEAVIFARNLANEQPGVCTPRWMAEQGKVRAEAHGLYVRVLDEEQLEEKGFGLHLAVARASDEPARLLHAIYRPKGEVHRRLALVGKGVTFDSGGYSIKPGDSMIDMHIDMAGGAAVLGAMDIIGAEKPAGVEVHFIVPMAENMVSGSGYKINEVIRGYNGKTVEVLNTDAEGRLLLADALAYAVDQGVDQVIDVATLTGACVVALGNETAGLFSSSETLRDAFVHAAKTADEAVWPMPLVERMEGQLKSRVADLKNVGSRWGGAISAAMFLGKFVGDAQWAHLDIAGPSMADKEWEYICAGGTGFGVLALAQWVRDNAQG